MTRLLLVAVTALSCLVAPAALAADEDRLLPDWAKSLRLRGRLKEEFAYRIADSPDFAKIRTIGWGDGKYDFSESLNLRVEVRAWWDGVFDATDRFPHEVRRDQQTELSLRQALLSWSAGPADVRVGRQQIVWGEAIGTFITDVVNPKDFREFILPDFTEIRIPLWALDVTYHIAEGVNLEGVWTPDVRFNRNAKPGSDFEFRSPAFQFPGPVVTRSGEQEQFDFGESAGGFRLSWLTKGWDLSLIYYDTKDPFQVLRQRRVPQDAGPPTTFLEPTHPRVHIVGGTVAKSIEPVVVRAEAAYTIGKRYETTDPTDSDGVVRRDTLDYLLGVDYTFFRTLDTAFQFSQKVLAGSAAHLRNGPVEDQVTSLVAVRVTTGFLDNTLNPTLLVIVSLNRGDYRISPKIEYLATGSVTIVLGAEVFGGPGHTLFGQFDSSDRAYLDVTWRF